MHSMTFNVCKDNQAAAKEFTKRVKAAGRKAEDAPVSDVHLAHHRRMGWGNTPATVNHDMEPDEALAIAMEIEEDMKHPSPPPPSDQLERQRAREQDRPSSSSPPGPWGGPDPRTQGGQGGP